MHWIIFSAYARQDGGTSSPAESPNTCALEAGALPLLPAERRFSEQPAKAAIVRPAARIRTLYRIGIMEERAGGSRALSYRRGSPHSGPRILCGAHIEIAELRARDENSDKSGAPAPIKKIGGLLIVGHAS